MKNLIKPSAAALFLALASFAPGVLQAQPKPQGRGMTLQLEPPIKQLPSASKCYALVIGVDNYADTQITTLGGASNDARALANALINYAGFPPDQVILLASDQPAERQPTRGNILRRLSNLAALAPKDGMLLFSFAGHGIERDGRAFLLPSDAQVSNDVTLLEQTAVNVSNIKEWVRKTGVGQVLLLLDACRNDPAGRADAPNPLTETYTRGFNFDVRNREVQAFATIYATEVGARAYEYKEKHQGYFTYMLVEGLKGAAANSKGEVTLASLVAYLQERVPRQVLIDLGAGKEQRPFAVIEGYKANELIVAVKPGTQTPAEYFKPDPNAVKLIANSRSAGGDGICACQCPCPCAVCPSSNDLTDLTGTVWTGDTGDGEFTIEFLAGGKLKYSIQGIQNGAPHTFTSPGTWTQAGKTILITVNSYSRWSGSLENGAISGTLTSDDGEKLPFILKPKK